MSASWFSISKSTLIDILRKLQTVFDTKADSSHTHTKSDITDFAHDHPLSIEAASTATSAINLDPNAIYKLTAGGKTFIFKTPADNDHYAWADITGKPSSYPPSSHTHTVSQITDFPSTMPPSSHTHGNIQNGGTLQTNDVAIANGDKLVITDSSDSSKIARASIAFDGSTATKCLTQKGTWENFTNNAGTVTSVKVGTTAYNPSSGVVSLPAYPTVNNGTLTLKRNNTSLGTFTANQSGNSDINFNVAVNETLTNQNLNSITTPGFYAAGGGNTCTNKPSGVDAFGLEVIHSASGNYYTQIIWSNTSAVPYRRNCNNGTWGSWALDKLTDTTYTFTNKGATLAWSTTSTIATVGGVDIKVTMPANPNTDHYAWSDITGKPSTFPPSAHTHVLSDSGINNMVFNNTDIPEGSGDLNTIATAHKITAYRNGFSIPYQMDNTNDGGIIRVRGTSESNCIFEFGTWDDSGAGETIQFNYYPTNSKDTPAHSVSVPKKTGTIALTSDIPTSLPASDVYAWAKASTKPSYTASEVGAAASSHTHGNIQNGGTLQTNDIAIANGDKLVVTDSSDSSKIARASISFDGSTATKCLTQKGTWETFASSNTDSKVAQTATTTNANYEVLFSETADNTTRTEGARKDSGLKYNPNSKIFNVSGSVKAEVIKAFNSAKLNTTTDTWAFNVADYNEATVFGVHFNNNMAIAELGNSYYGEGYKARGYLRIYGDNTAYTSLSSNVSTTNRDINFPDKSGTIALTSDITDSKVIQIGGEDSTWNNSYELLFSATPDNATRTEGARKSSRLKFNPYSGALFMYNVNDKTCFTLEGEAYTTSTSATVARLTIGNNTASGTAGNRYASIRLYSKKSGYVDLQATDNTAKYTATLQAKSGTIALTSDLSNYLPLTGDTLTGTLINSAANAYICSFSNQHYMLRNDGNYWYFMSSSTAGGWDKGYILFDASMNLNMAGHTISGQSDRRSKKDITLVNDDKLMNFYSQLKPSRFKFIDNVDDKYKYGFIAQEVEEAMNNNGISVKDKALIRLPEEDHSMGEPRYSLSYMEFIPLNTRMIQLLTKRIEALESKLT